MKNFRVRVERALPPFAGSPDANSRSIGGNLELDELTTANNGSAIRADGTFAFVAAAFMSSPETSCSGVEAQSMTSLGISCIYDVTCSYPKPEPEWVSCI